MPVCPVCAEEERGVEDPESGKWYCFHCGSNGTVERTYEVTHDGTEG